MIRKLRSRKGSIVAMLMGTVAMVGIVGVSAMNMIGGPITTAAKVTHQNMAQNDLLMNAKVVVMNASTRPNQGDEDGDGYVEPVPFIPISTSSCNITLPTGSSGGCLPSDIGAILTDPWGTQYMYCVWDHGDPATSANRITGEDSTSGAVLAIISAGPNKRFETPCRAYDGDPATNDDAINPDGIGDDLVQIYTYAAAVAGSGGLWELKQNEPETAIIDKKLEIGDVSSGTGFAFDTATGQGEFPYIKTDFIASKSGGNKPVTMVNNIALDGNWLSGNGTNKGVFIAANGNVGINTSTPLAPISYYGYPARNHGDAITALADYKIVLGCKLQQGNCNTATAAGISTGVYTNSNSQPAISLEYRAKGHAFHVGSDLNAIMRLDPDFSYQNSTAMIRSRSAAAGKGILSLQNSAGNDVLTVLNNGNVGIGTSTPANALDVKGNITLGAQNAVAATIAPTSAQGVDSDGAHLVLRAGATTGAGTAGEVRLFPSLSSEHPGNEQRRNDTSKGLYLQFQRTGWDAHPNLFALNAVLGSGTSLGNLSGLGGGSTVLTLEGGPGALEIIGTGNTAGSDQGFISFYGSSYRNPYAKIAAKTDSTDYTTGGLIFRARNEGVEHERLRLFGDGTTLFSANGSEHMRIAPNGRVGIGVPNPTETMQVNGRIDVTNNRILRVATPTAATDAANKAYVDSLGGKSCSNGQVLKWNGTTWACAGDNIGAGGDNLGNHTATNNLMPSATNTHDIGSTFNRWKSGYFEHLASRTMDLYRSAPAASEYADAYTLNVTNTAAVGRGTAIRAYTTSPSGYGIMATGANNGQGTAAYFDSISPSATVVNVQARSSTGNTYGMTVYASQSPNGTGIRTSGGQYGLDGWTTNGRAVRGWASGSTGTNYGIFGQTNSPEGYGVYSHGRMHSTGALTVGNSVTATAFSGNGSSLTNLNASSLASGTVPIARIGTGTKNTTTFLRGDGTFAVPPTGADNLGNHTATANLNMSNRSITADVGTIRDASGGWVRTYGATGWYNQTYGGGWHMQDTTWIRAYSNKSVVTGGNMQAAAFLYGSDERLKADIRPLNLSLDDLDGIGTYRYHYRADEDETPHIGVIAQEVQAVFPEAVQTGEDGMLSVDYPALVPVLLEAVKQLKADNDAIRHQMKDENDNLREEIRALTKGAR